MPGFKLELGTIFFTEKVVKHCSGLPREVVEPPSLKALKEQLDVALNAVV